MTENITKELVLMLENDQKDLNKFRTGVFTLKQVQSTVDVRTTRLKEIIKDEFPNIKNSGVQAYTATLVMILHSGDQDLIKSYLNKHERLPEDMVNPSHRAILIDKLLVLEGKSQRYGTQFVIKEGKPEILPLENAEKVNEQRASLGLNSLEDYVEGISNAPIS